MAFGSFLLSWLFVSKYLYLEIILAMVATFRNVGLTFFVASNKKSRYSTIPRYGFDFLLSASAFNVIHSTYEYIKYMYNKYTY